VHATFIDAGHILGSASIFLELEEQSHSTSVLFSGDLSNAGRLLLRSPATPPHAENVVMGTTYGDRLHKPLGPSIDELFLAITETFKRGGNVIILTFALEHAQELLYFLSEGVTQGRLANSTQVFLDSPMAISATEIFRRHPECFEPATAKLFQDGHDPLDLPGLHFARETADSVAINSISGGVIIMAGSGMCTGGRVRHHLQHNLGREKSSVVFVGYAALELWRAV
jgi:metallo-beta-lactamase family protein